MHLAFALGLVALASASGCGEAPYTEVRLELLYPTGQRPLEHAATIEVSLRTPDGDRALEPIQRPESGSWDELDTSISLGGETIERARVRLEGLDDAGDVVAAGESVPIPIAVGRPGSARIFLQETGSSGAAPPLAGARTGHAAAYLEGGGVLLVGGDSDPTAATVYALDTYEPVAVAPSPEPRTAAAGLGLADGTALVLGGSEPSSAASLYDPANDSWQAVSLPAEFQGAWPRPPVSVTAEGAVVAARGRSIVEIAGDPLRARLVAVIEGPELETGTLSVLPSGVAIAVGSGVPAAAAVDIATGAAVDIADPPMGPRTGHVASVLPDGRLVLAAGSSASQLLEDVEVLDPEGLTWGVLEGLLASHGRVAPAAALLVDGRIALAGGRDGSGRCVADAVFVDVDSGRVEIVPLVQARADHTGNRLPSGALVVVGGVDSEGRALDSVEIVLPSIEASGQPAQ